MNIGYKSGHSPSFVHSIISMYIYIIFNKCTYYLSKNFYFYIIENVIILFLKI